MSAPFAWNANDVFLYLAHQNVLQGMGVCDTVRADGLPGKKISILVGGFI